MLKDPQASVPYDLLAEVGIGPYSSTKEVLDASFLLMEQGRWSPEVRRAWDELRTVERRLAVDFLLYDMDVGDVEQPAPLLGADVVEFDR